MKSMKRFTAIILCLVMALGNFSFAFADTAQTAVTTTSATTAAKDYEGHWAQSTIQQWISEGKISGYPDGSFKPDNKITRAEFVTLVNSSLVDYASQNATTFNDVKSGDWYYNGVSTAYEAGYISGYSQTQFAPNENISRQEAAAIMSRIQYLAENKAAANFGDASKISSWALGQVGAAAEAGFVKGYNGNFMPLNNLTRAEAVTMLNNVLENGKNKVIYKAGTELKDTTVQGDLIIAKTVGEGDVHLTNVEVKGNIQVYGGGVNSIYFNNVKVAKIIVEKDKVRLVLDDGTTVQEIAVGSEAKLENLGGTVANVSIDSEGKVTLAGDFEGVTVSSSADVVLDDAKIASLTVEKPISILGTGTIATLTANSNGIQYDSTLGITETVTGTGVTEKPVIISAGGGGGGGGGIVPETPKTYAVNISAEIVDEQNPDNSKDFSFTTSEYSDSDMVAYFMKDEIHNILYDDTQNEKLTSLLNSLNVRLGKTTINGIPVLSADGWNKAIAYLKDTSYFEHALYGELDGDGLPIYYEGGLDDIDLINAVSDGLDINDLQNLEHQFTPNLNFISGDIEIINNNLKDYPFNSKEVKYDGETVTYSITYSDNGETVTLNDNKAVAEFILNNLIFATCNPEDLFTEYGDTITITGTSNSITSTVTISKVELE